MTRVAHGLDLPGDPRLTLALHIGTPQGDHRVDEPARRVDFEDLTLAEMDALRGHAEVEGRADLPVRGDPGAEVVLAPDLGIGDGLPEALGCGADVDLVNLLHLTLQSLFDVAEPCHPGFGVLAPPPVVDEPDRDRIQEVELLAA